MSKLMSAATVAGCFVVPSLAAASPQDSTLSGTYVLSESMECVNGGSQQYSGTMKFDPATGAVSEHISFVAEGVKNGRKKLEFWKSNLSGNPYTLSKTKMTINGVSYRLAFGTLNNGVASYASLIGISQGKDLTSCKMLGTLVHIER